MDPGAIGRFPQEGPLVCDSPNCDWAGVTPAEDSTPELRLPLWSPTSFRLAPPNSVGHGEFPVRRLLSFRWPLGRGFDILSRSPRSLPAGERLWHLV